MKNTSDINIGEVQKNDHSIPGKFSPSDAKKRRINFWMAFSVILIILSVVSFTLLLNLKIDLKHSTNDVTSKPSSTQPTSSEKIGVSTKTYDFLYLQNDPHVDILWLVKVSTGDKKPTAQKLADPVKNYSVSNSKTKVAYVSDDQLKVKDICGGDEKLIQKLIPDDYQQDGMNPQDYYAFATENYAWSPDEKKLAFVGGSDYQADIYVIDIDGKNLKRLTNDKLNEYSLRWSPDSNKIAFLTTENYAFYGYQSSYGVAVVNHDGNSYTQIAANSKLPNGHSFYSIECLHWLNSNKLVFSTWIASDYTYDGIWEADIGNKQVVPLNKLRGGFPVWSEKNLSFLYPLEEKDFLIADAKGGTVKKIKTNSKVNQTSWSQDGKKILYETSDDNLFIADSDGNNSIKLLSDQNVHLNRCSISSDNNRIVYTKFVNEPEVHSELWVINSDGSDNRALEYEHEYNIFWPYITPDSNSVIYTKGKSGEDRHYYLLDLDTLSKQKFASGVNFVHPIFLSD